MSKVRDKIKEEKFKDLARALTETLVEKEVKKHPRPGAEPFDGLSEKSVGESKKYLRAYLERKGFAAPKE